MYGVLFEQTGKLLSTEPIKGQGKKHQINKQVNF